MKRDPEPNHVHGHDPSYGPEGIDAPERAAWQRPARVVLAMEIDRGMTVADVGAGTGYFLPYLSVAVGPSGEVIALDHASDRVASMRERIAAEGLVNVSARQSESESPGLPEASVDRILLVNVWHHIQPDRPAYARALRAALRPGAALYVVEPRHPPLREEHEGHDEPRGHGELEGHDHHLNGEWIARELRAARLEASTLPLDLPRQYVVRARRPQ